MNLEITSIYCRASTTPRSSTAASDGEALSLLVPNRQSTLVRGPAAVEGERALCSASTNLQPVRREATRRIGNRKWRPRAKWMPQLVAQR
jgi:hypothetical protein